MKIMRTLDQPCFHLWASSFSHIWATTVVWPKLVLGFGKCNTFMPHLQSYQLNVDVNSLEVSLTVQLCHQLIHEHSWEASPSYMWVCVSIIAFSKYELAVQQPPGTYTYSRLCNFILLHLYVHYLLPVGGDGTIFLFFKYFFIFLFFLIVDTGLLDVDPKFQDHWTFLQLIMIFYTH